MCPTDLADPPSDDGGAPVPLRRGARRDEAARNARRDPRRALALALSLLGGAAHAGGDASLETHGEDHRVREGLVAAPEQIGADAERAAAGVVVGATPAHAMLRRTLADPLAPSSTGAREVAETRSREQATWIADLDVLLRDDTDRDGFYTTLELSIDVDTDGVERDVYAVIELTESGGGLTLRHTSATFTVRGYATSDIYRLEIELLDEHVADYRDAHVEIRDAWRGDLLDQASPWSFATLSALPLESERGTGYVHDDDPYAADRHGVSFVFGGGSSYGSSTQVRENGAVVAGYAGAAGPLGALALLAALAFRHGRRSSARRRPVRSL